MLYMVIGKHTPDNCPIYNKATGEKVLGISKRNTELKEKFGVTVKGSWSDISAHTIYYLIDAPNAHVLSQYSIELGMLEWQTSEIHAVVTSAEAMALRRFTRL